MGDVARFDQIVAPVVAWAERRSDILGLAVAGPWARGTASGDSDIDLILLAAEPQAFRTSDWLDEIRWPAGRVADWHDAEYGVAWSRHLQLMLPCEIEFTFCSPAWAEIDPVDAGTAQVVSGGCRVLLDKSAMFKRLLAVNTP
jgi:hypothetical protein